MIAAAMPNASLLLALAALSAASAQPGRPGPKPQAAIDFATAAQASDQYEILSSRIALVESRDPAVRGFARHMIDDHRATGEALGRALARSGIVPPPPGLGAEGAMMLGALQGVSGPEFDRAYAKQQALAHQRALVVEQDYAATGADPNLREAAGAAIPIIRAHLAMAQAMAADAAR